MLRKFGHKLGLALFAAMIVVAGSAGVSTSASAHSWGGHGGYRGGGHYWGGGGFRRGWGGWGPGFYAGGPAYYGYGYGGCVVRRPVPTPWGWRYRLVNRCY